MQDSTVPEHEGDAIHAAASPVAPGSEPEPEPDRLPDERLDSLTRVARRHFGVAVALIILGRADEHYCASYDGLPSGKAPLGSMCCEAAVSGDGILLLPSSLANECLNELPAIGGIPHIRFSTGYPLSSPDGSRIGSLWLLDDKPHELGAEQLESLRDLARLAADIVERDGVAAALKAGQAALRDSERRMALAIAGSGTGIWDRNIPANEIHYSAGWKAILGYAETELTNLLNDSYKRVHPDDLAYVQATIQDHFEQKTESYEVEHRIRCKDGSYKWISSRGKVVSRDSAGRPLRMIGTTTDVTAMRAMSERLQQTVDLITSLTDEVPGLVFQYRRMPGGESFFSYASGGISDIYEVTPQQVAGSADAIDAILHPDDRAIYRASFDTSAASLAPWNLEYRVQLPRQGLRWRQGHAQPRRLDDGSTLWHGFITDVTERKRIEEELHEFATIDFMTQLPNRRHFMVQLEKELARVQCLPGRSAAVLMCDLDYFKSINDNWGHAAGDLTLRHFAAILRSQLRKSDIAGRVGGEEFAVVLPETTIADATTFGRRLQHRLTEAPLLEGDRQITLTVSIGITAVDATDISADASLSRSDMALYRAKVGGRNRIECA